MADQLGNFEMLVLIAAFRLGEGAYGATIHRDIEEHTGRFISVGALYQTLRRLEIKGYISSRTGEATPERGGRAKRYYSLSSLGRAALRETASNFLSMLSGLDTEFA